jgi:hypothetical protein
MKAVGTAVTYHSRRVLLCTACAWSAGQFRKRRRLLPLMRVREQRRDELARLFSHRVAIL